jgi:hypothetical protein
MADYTNGGKIRVSSSAVPESRPTYEEWIRMYNINETAYQNDPDGRAKAERIMNKVGIEYDERTVWEIVTGTMVSESRNFVKKVTDQE